MTKATIVVRRWPRTPGELFTFIEAMWGRRIPTEQVCPDHVAPFDALCEAYFAWLPLTVWIGSRGLSGKSVQLSTMALTEAVTMGVDCAVLGGSAAQSLNVHEHTAFMWAHNNAPRHLLRKDPTRYETHLINGARIRALLASQRSVRGPHPARLRLDEIDEMELGIFDSALGQPMPQRGVQPQTTATSTHQYPEGTVSEVLKRAADNSAYQIRKWCYRESMGTEKKPGWLTREEVERKRAVIPPRVWETEFELQEPSFEGRVFSDETLDFTFDPNVGQWSGDPEELIIVEPPEDGARYITGVDWGRKKDWSVIRTFRDEGMLWREVAFERIARTSWHHIVSRANQRMITYPGLMIHDETGVGDVVRELIELPYGSEVKGVVINQRMREVMNNEYVAAMQGSHLKCPRVAYVYGEHRYLTNDDLFGRGHTPDTVSAGALAWNGRNDGRSGPILPLIVEDFARAASPWKI